MSKKQSYMNLLKQAISEFDTSDNLEVKGPMLDPIISWDGGGEIPTYKDAASILERYYFNEDQDEGVHVLDEEDAATMADKRTGEPLSKAEENDKGEASGKGMQNAKGAGTEQAGTSDSPSILGSKEEKKEDIAKEDVDLALDDLETAIEESLEAELLEDEWSDKDVPKAKKFREEEMTTEDEDISEDMDMENAIIEKLISEMEEDELEEKDIMGYEGDDVAPGMNAKDEKKSRDSEEDTQGAGTQQAGTGPDEGQIPDRKDMRDKMVKPQVYRGENMTTEGLEDLESDILEDLEVELSEAEGEGDMPEPEGGDEGKELDVDTEMKESLDVLEQDLMEELDLVEADSAVPGGPSPKKTGEDWEEDERYYGEAFELFKEEIENEEVEDIDSDDLRV